MPPGRHCRLDVLRLVGSSWRPASAGWRTILAERERILAIELTFVAVRGADQFEQTFFSDIGKAKAQALYVVDDPLFFAQRATLLKLAAAARLPTLHELSRFPEEGALMSYGPAYTTCSVALPATSIVS